MAQPFPTEFLFLLPDGLATEHGDVVRNGKMRLATAGDEIISMGDYRASDNKAYAVIVLLSRVIVSIGPLNRVYPDQLEALSERDLNYLQDYYEKINQVSIDEVLCPTCGSPIVVDPVNGAVSENTNAPNKPGRR